MITMYPPPHLQITKSIDNSKTNKLLEVTIHSIFQCVSNHNFTTYEKMLKNRVGNKLLLAFSKTRERKIYVRL